MKLRFVILVCLLVALVSMALLPLTYQVQSVYHSGAWICIPSNAHCTVKLAAPIIPGTGSRLPAVGAYCKQVGVWGGYPELLCGKCGNIHLVLYPNPE
jgi:hypothetical protein